MSGSQEAPYCTKVYSTVSYFSVCLVKLTFHYILAPVFSSQFLSFSADFVHANSASYSMDNEVLSQGHSDQRMRFTTNLHLAPYLRMRSAIPPLPLYTLMACKLHVSCLRRASITIKHFIIQQMHRYINRRYS
jgi:hypothetical protein